MQELRRQSQPQGVCAPLENPTARAKSTKKSRYTTETQDESRNDGKDCNSPGCVRLGARYSSADRPLQRGMDAQASS